jgi:hypothetical protein
VSAQLGDRTAQRSADFLLGSYIDGVLVKLNPGLRWQKLNLTRRRIFLPANWT